MRDIAVTIAFFIGLGYTIKSPHIGILLWSWLGYMNPHRLCYGFAYSMPFSYITALVTLLSFLFSNENKRFPKDGLMYLFFVFILWMGITTNFAFRPEEAQEQYLKILKIQFPIILTLLMFNTKERIEQLLWVIIISLGYFGAKGGVFTLLTGGSFRVYGPPESFVSENNTLAVASLMVMPLIVYMIGQLEKKWQKNILLFALISIGFSVLGSQSRGAFLAISVVGTYFWLQSKNKIFSGILIALFVSIAIPFLPESWFERMNTIGTYEEDESALGRIHAWILAINVANHNIFGGGLNLWAASIYSQYLAVFNPLTMTAFVAHSIYFSVLGEHGWVGLFLFVSIFFLAWHYCSQIIKQCDGKTRVQWLADLAKMIKISFLAYASGGAFLSLSYYDLPWHLVAIVILLKGIMRQNELQPSLKYDDQHNNKECSSLKPKIKIDPQGYIV